MPKIYSQQELMDMWGYGKSTIKQMEYDGLLHRLTKMPGVRYREKEVLELEGLNEKDRRVISPFEYHQAILRAENDEKKIARLEGKLAQIAAIMGAHMVECAEKKVAES